VGGAGTYMNIYDLLYVTELGVCKQAIGTYTCLNELRSGKY